MVFSAQEITEYSAFMQRLADRADAIARQYFNASIGYELKADASPVTIADKEIEMALIADIRTTYPNHGIFGEETRRHNPDSTLQWVIDPIDGTRAFIAGKPTFVTLIALCKDNAPLLGLISQAIQTKRWLSSELKPAADQNTILSSAALATTSIPYFTAQESILFQKLEQETASILLNQDGLAGGLMVDGQVDLLLESGLKPYDFAALAPVIEAAGGIVSDWAGKPLTLASDGKLLAARNKSLHKQALKMLQAAK